MTFNPITYEWEQMRVTQSQLDMMNAGNPTPKKHKYNAQKTTIDGISFDSLKEGRRYQELKLQQKAGYISNLKCHPKRFVLQSGFENKNVTRKQIAITYTPDFSYIKNGILIYEDAKGFRTDVYKIKKKLLLKKYPDINFVET